jgi:predicted alpha/beta superfamily hydrolase
MKHLNYVFVLMVFFFSCKEAKNKSIDSDTKTKIVSKQIEDINISSGTIQRVESFPSKYVQPRNVDVWLPDNYSKNKKYAVLYMHDGQMLFDATTTWNKQEWMVDEIASKLMKEGITKDFIVVGIYNIPDIRWQDLFPEKAFNFLKSGVKDSLFTEAINADINTKLNGDNYLKFLVKEVKPFIDSTYSTKIDIQNTFVSGSSMGGLMSMYAISEYPDVFGGAACLSTHWPGAAPKESNPIPNAIFTYLEANAPNPENHKLYFDFGTKTLDQHYPQYEVRVNQIFTAKGFDETNFRNLKFEGADHSEDSWNQRLDIPLTFLLKK